MKDTLVLAFCRCNPPTCGHVKLMRKLEEIADRENGEAILCLSKSCDSKKNPLSFDEKSHFIKEYVQELGINIGVETPDTFEKNKTVFQILPCINKQWPEVNKIIFVCGSDRDLAFQSILKYNGEEQKNPDNYYEFDSIDIESSGERLEDGDDLASKASASQMRQFAKDDDFESFAAMCPDFGENEDLAREMFNLTKRHLLNESSSKQKDFLKRFFEKRLNLHQVHLEDLVVLNKEGMSELLDKSRTLVDMLSSKKADHPLTVTTKIDGAPALVVWTEYEGLPSPGVSLKGFMASGTAEKVADLCFSSKEEILEKYPDRPNMTSMMIAVLEALQNKTFEIPADEAWQGDLLFSRSSIEKFDLEEGSFIGFQPNTILYAVPESSDAAKKILNCDAGAAFHTRYTGPIGDLKQTFNLDVNRDAVSLPDNLYIIDAQIPNLTDQVQLSNEQIEHCQELIDELQEAYVLFNHEYAKEYNALCNNEEFVKMYFQTFQNKNISDKQRTTFDEENFINDLRDYCESKINNALDKKLAKLKTDKGKINAKAKSEELCKQIIDIIDNNAELLQWVVSATDSAAELKMILLKEMSKAKMLFNVYYKTASGVQIGTQEGLAVSDDDGNIVKLVDRSCFSFHNRDAGTIKGWQHPED